jgi:hypothetical protein
MRCRPLTIASTMKPLSANGSMSGHNAANRDRRNPLAARLVAERRRARTQSRLGEAVGSIGRDQPRCSAGNDRHSPVVHPAALQRRDIAGQP